MHSSYFLSITHCKIKPLSIPARIRIVLQNQVVTALPHLYQHPHTLNTARRLPLYMSELNYSVSYIVCPWYTSLSLYKR